jgi:hypothetical protein
MRRRNAGVGMKRREFLGVVGGAVAWPVKTHAQQIERTIGVLFGGFRAGGVDPVMPMLLSGA